MARFYSNENFPLPVVLRLRALGHDVLTIQETGNADQATPDEQVLRFSVETGRVLLTLNRLHFIRLHQANPNHLGIVVCTFDPDFERQALAIDRLTREAAPLTGVLLRVNRPAH